MGCSHRKGFASHVPFNFLRFSFSQSLLGLGTQWKSWTHFRDQASSPLKELSTAYASCIYLDLLVNYWVPYSLLSRTRLDCHGGLHVHSQGMICGSTNSLAQNKAYHFSTTEPEVLPYQHPSLVLELCKTCKYLREEVIPQVESSH